MNVIIAGGGVAGLTAAAVLRKLPFVKSILIFEPTLRPILSSQAVTNLTKTADNEHSPASKVVRNTSNQHRTEHSHHYNGLWNPALHCLKSIGIYDKIVTHLHGVRTSGYKDFSGRWIMQPSVGLQEPPSTLVKLLNLFLHLYSHLFLNIFSNLFLNSYVCIIF